MKKFSNLTACAVIAVVCVAITAPGPVRAATINVDLDRNGSLESSLILNLVSSYPIKFEAKVTNKAVGKRFDFNWKSAGPAGFISQTCLGTSTGCGAKWTYTTLQSLYSFTGNKCGNDVCFFEAGKQGIFPQAAGPFTAPGRSLYTTGVTTTTETLTSSLITFFSPGNVVVEANSTVGPAGAGQIKFTTEYTNNSDQDVVLYTAEVPAGCCEAPNQLNCPDPAYPDVATARVCVNYLTDDANCGGCGSACADGYSCLQGECISDCPPGLTYCGGTCVDLADPANCGACGNACNDTSICMDGFCVPCQQGNEIRCDNQCVNYRNDPYNCGGCGISCFDICPSGGTCSNGNSCVCNDTTTVATTTTETAETPSYTPTATGSVILPPPAPLCESPAQRTVIPPGGTYVECEFAAVRAKEGISKITACGDGIPTGEFCIEGAGSSGPFPKFLPDLAAPIQPFEPSITSVVVHDASGNGLLEPGETGTLSIGLNNIGTDGLSNVAATLIAVPADLTAIADDNGDPIPNPNPNPKAIAVLQQSSLFSGGIPAYPQVAATDCTTAAPPAAEVFNDAAYPFQVQIPADLPSDLPWPMKLQLTGTTSAGPYSKEIPFNLGVAAKCDVNLNDRNYDGVDGLLSPMAKLVPDGETALYPSKPFSGNKTLPLKMRVLCGGVNLRGGQFDSPQIIGLYKVGVGPIDIQNTIIDDSNKSNNPFFFFNEKTQQWSFNLSTSALGTGRFILTIRLADRKDYVTGFELR